MSKALYKKICELNKISIKSTDQKVIKLMEEVGEFSAEHLKLSHQKGAKGKSRAEVLQEAKWEIADIILMVFSIADDYDMSYNDIKDAVDEKLKGFQGAMDKQHGWKDQFSDG